MKRLIAIMICLVLACSVCACGGKKEDSDKEVVTTAMASSENDQEESTETSEANASAQVDTPTLEDLGYESEEAPKIEPDSESSAVAQATLTWHGPKNSKKYVVEISGDSGKIRVLNKSKKTICLCSIPEGMLLDMDHVMEALKFEDFNGDGYDDLYVEDLQDDNPMHHVFFWNADAKKFEIEAGA